MKNKFLLLGATALLSTGLVMGVMAEDEVPEPHGIYSDDTVSPVIYAKAKIVKPLTVSSSSEEPIDFGTMVFEKGKYVTINTAGQIDENSTDATVYDTQRSSARIHLSGTSTIANMVDNINSYSDDDEFTAEISSFITFEIPVITLKAGDNVICGVVTNFDKKYHLANDGIDVYVGGTFMMITDDITMPANGYLDCSGNVTATLVFPRDYLY